jgi:hypothetical protein
MVLSYKCKKVGCGLRGTPVPEIQCVRSTEDGGYICVECREPMIVAETADVSGRRDSGRDGPSGPMVRPRPKPPRGPKRPRRRNTRGKTRS